MACASSSGAEVFNGRWKSMPCAAASNSMATMVPEFRAISPRRRAAKVAMET